MRAAGMAGPAVALLAAMAMAGQDDLPRSPLARVPWPQAAMASVENVSAPVARGASARPDMVTDASAAAVERALAHLARTQGPDGSWRSSFGSHGGYPAAMTSLAGMALLAGGSTPREGPYSRQVRRAMLYLLGQAASSKDGLISTEHQPMFGHGFAMLFLAQCYGVEGSSPHRQAIRRALERAVALTAAAQSSQGGWTYYPRGGDEGSVTVTQLQALRACRNVGIAVPAQTIRRAVNYLLACQNADGGICYSYECRGGPSRPAISAAAIACFHAAGVYDQPAGGDAPEARALEKLVAYCTGSPALQPGNASGHFFYAHLYMTQAMYQLGGPAWREYYPKIRDQLVQGMQAEDGSWMGDHVGKTYGTAVGCIILQMPYGYLPGIQR